MMQQLIGRIFRERAAEVGAVLLLALSLVTPAAASDFILRVDGLACPFCAYGVEKKLLAVPGIASIEVLLDEGQIVLSFSREAELDVAALDSAVEKAGFTLRGLLVRDAVGTLSRDGGDELFLTSSDPRITFRLSLDANDAPPAVRLVGSPGRVVASGTVTDFHALPAELVVSEIAPAETRRP